MRRERTIVHLVRHGEVHNPTGVLYGRLPGFHLSEAGRQMALRIADHFKDIDLVEIRSSPLERAQETAAPIAEKLGLPVLLDERLTEAENVFQGQVLSLNHSALRNPLNWRYLRNPIRPSWGEPYAHIAARMNAAIKDAARDAAGGEALIVSHQLPIWIARCAAEGRRLFHDPRKRQCGLASVTSFTFLDGRLAGISYQEPAADLVNAISGRRFVAGA